MMEDIPEADWAHERVFNKYVMEKLRLEGGDPTAERYLKLAMKKLAKNITSMDATTTTPEDHANLGLALMERAHGAISSRMLYYLKEKGEDIGTGIWPEHYLREEGDKIDV